MALPWHVSYASQQVLSLSLSGYHTFFSTYFHFHIRYFPRTSNFHCIVIQSTQLTNFLILRLKGVPQLCKQNLPKTFLTIFLFSIIMVVAAIYCIVIIYIPSIEEQKSTILPEPKRCVTTEVLQDFFLQHFGLYDTTSTNLNI